MKDVIDYRSTKDTYQCAYRPYIHDDLPHNMFYQVQSGMYKQLGHLPVCKNCFDEMYDDYLQEYGKPQLAMKRMCLMFDVYYNGELFEKSKFSVQNYFKKLNMVQYKKKSLTDSFKENEIVVTDSSNTKVENGDKEKVKHIATGGSEKQIKRWGVGLDQLDYNNLDKHYEYLKKSNPDCDSNQEIFIQDLCYIKMQQLRAIRDGDTDSFIKLNESYGKTFSRSELKAGNDAYDQKDFTIGVTAATIEKYTPAEYYKDKKLYSDYDGLGDYYKRFLLRPLRNLMHGTHDRDKEYYVKDEESNSKNITSGGGNNE